MSDLKSQYDERKQIEIRRQREEQRRRRRELQRQQSQQPGQEQQPLPSGEPGVFDKRPERTGDEQSKDKPEHMRREDRPDREKKAA